MLCCWISEWFLSLKSIDICVVIELGYTETHTFFSSAVGSSSNLSSDFYFPSCNLSYVYVLVWDSRISQGCEQFMHRILGSPVLWVLHPERWSPAFKLEMWNRNSSHAGLYIWASLQNLPVFVHSSEPLFFVFFFMFIVICWRVSLLGTGSAILEAGLTWCRSLQERERPLDGVVMRLGGVY